MVEIDWSACMNLFRSKSDGLDTKALDEFGVIINLRDALSRIRNGDEAGAIGLMEMFLDCVLLSVASEPSKYSPAVSELLKGELRRMKVYRTQHPAFDEAYLNTLEPELKKRTLERRREVERILSAI